MKKVAVIGGGPAGMLAAAAAAERGHTVTLIEKNEKLGKKLFITGKGRCNITNAADTEEFFKNIPRNPKFLYSALYGYTNEDIIALLQKMGVPTKTERGGRVFPASDKSSDIIRAFAAHVNRAGVEVLLNTTVDSIARAENGGFVVMAGGRERTFDALILSTGGASYPSTGPRFRAHHYGDPSGTDPSGDRGRLAQSAFRTFTAQCDIARLQCKRAACLRGTW